MRVCCTPEMESCRWVALFDRFDSMYGMSEHYSIDPMLRNNFFAIPFRTQIKPHDQILAILCVFWYGGCDIKNVDLHISVYNTCALLWNNVKYVDVNLDAPDNAISGNEPSSEMLTSQSQIPEWAKTGNAKEWRPK